MSPALSQNDFTNGIVAETKISANTGHSFARGMAGSDREHDLGIEGFAVPTVLEGMASIPLWSAPFKVRNNVIGPDEVDVVDLRQIVRVGEEGDTHQSMNEEMSGFSISQTKSYAAISIFIGIGKQNLWMLCDSFRRSTPSISHHSSKTLNAPHAGNFVKALKSYNGPPFFDGHIASPKACDLAPTFVTNSRGRSQIKELATCL